MAPLARVFELLSDAERLAALWRERDLFTTVGCDALEVTVGIPDEATLRGVGARLHATGRELPGLLVAFLRRHDGFNVREIEEPRSVRIVGGDQYGSGLVHAGALELEALQGED